MGRLQGNAYFHEHICQLQVSYASVKPVFYSHISPSVAKNFATEKFYSLFFGAINRRSNKSCKFSAIERAAQVSPAANEPKKIIFLS